MKKAVAFLVILILCISLFPMGASAQIEGDFSYTLENGEATITGYNGNGGTVIIPDTLGESPVVTIGEKAFMNCNTISIIKIPNGVTSIETAAFAHCSFLTSVKLPDSLKSIGINAFGDCEQLSSLSIPNSVTSIGGAAFSFCTGLTYIKFPNSITAIENRTFYWCSSLPSVEIPNGVITIGEEAFAYSGLTWVEFPNSVTTIGDSAFSGCSNLTSVTLPNSVTSIGRSAFYNCVELSSVTMPKNATVEENAFHATPYQLRKNIALALIIFLALDGILLVFIIKRRKKKMRITQAKQQALASQASAIQYTAPITNTQINNNVLIPTPKHPIAIPPQNNIPTKANSIKEEYSQILATLWPEWQLEQELGKGSYGVVYQAVRSDSSFRSFSAIKVVSIPSHSGEISSLRADGLDDAGIRTFFQGLAHDFVKEIQVMELLKGMQNVVGVEDYKVVEQKNEIGFHIFIRMELLTSFERYLEQNPITQQMVITLGKDICSALEWCHKERVIHRDIKPENLFVSHFGNFKLGDFGIARTLENATAGLSQKGTYNYMAPEVTNSNHYDHRVDIYSLGLVLHRLLNDRLPPFVTEENRMNAQARMTALERRLQGEDLPPPMYATPQLSQVILKACAFSPDQRYASASEMKAALEQVERGELQPPATFDETLSVRSVK